jgi:pyruvate/2-oxoglutarate dehydrogenase complex dihydrolipoamide dehydrogenase (E3) component/uncharacterized membrane protein YdjX (TVP38/TMEM64 family)
MNRKQAGLALIIVTLAVTYLAFDLGRFLRLDYLKHSQRAFEILYAEKPWQVTATYFAIYVAAAAMSLPGAVMLTLAGGAIFGLWWGTLIVSFASSLGATLAFLAARFALRDSIEARFGQRLTEFNRGIEKQGALYLFTLRLVPLVPFFVINLLMGLTPMKTLTYYGVSQIGMLAGTLVYVNAGTQLAQLESLQGILSPALIGSFVLLGIFPLLTRKAADALQRRQAYARWKHLKPRRFDRNLIVIGGGAGGLVSAYIAAAVKAKVTLVEASSMGGDCLNYGCVPSKALIRSAKIAHQWKNGATYGFADGTPSFSFKTVMQRVHEVIATIAPHDSVARYTGLGVEVLQGHAKIVNPWAVQITLADGSQQMLTTRAIVIAAGARPLVPPLAGIDDVGYLTSDTLWDQFAKLDQVPTRLLVLGGGPVGCELAQSFQRLGAQVTLIEMAPRLMLQEDADVSALIQATLTQEGVQVLTSHKALRCEKQGQNKALIVDHAGQERRIEFDTLLCAAGRVARLTGYGLEELGIPAALPRGGTVQIDNYLQTLYPNIFAVGDVAGPYQFTHVAAHQAWYAVVNALFGSFRKFKVDYAVIPWTTFMDPEVARVGLSEQQAKEKNIAFEITRYEIGELDRAIADSEAHGFVKVLTVPGRDKILGVTIVASHAGDLLAEYVLAMKHGLGLNKILGTIHSYPTWAEANKYTAGVWKLAHQPVALLQWARRYHDWRRG